MLNTRTWDNKSKWSHILFHYRVIRSQFASQGFAKVNLQADVTLKNKKKKNWKPNIVSVDAESKLLSKLVPTWNNANKFTFN